MNMFFFFLMSTLFQTTPDRRTPTPRSTQPKPKSTTTVKLEGRSGQFCLEVVGDALFTDAACGGKRVTAVSLCVFVYDIFKMSGWGGGNVS